uniref:Uncharacterized protein n=1 Tax=viral metagenome TaxID=1070528 RepID=A0A6C0H0K7_9ZZZZ
MSRKQDDLKSKTSWEDEPINNSNKIIKPIGSERIKPISWSNW